MSNNKFGRESPETLCNSKAFLEFLSSIQEKLNSEEKYKTLSQEWRAECMDEYVYGCFDPYHMPHFIEEPFNFAPGGYEQKFAGVDVFFVLPLAWYGTWPKEVSIAAVVINDYIALYVGGKLICRVGKDFLVDYDQVADLRGELPFFPFMRLMVALVRDAPMLIPKE